jgi:hypothetical protein
VYLWTGGTATTGDNGSANAPLASKVPVQTASGLQYQFTFLDPGSYTVGFTCNAAGDNADQDDHLAFAPVVNNVAVSAGATTSVNLP